jgi:hypothetical protein
MPHFNTRRSSPLRVIAVSFCALSFCAMLAAAITASGALARVLRHQQEHQPVAHHPRRHCARRARRRHRAHRAGCAIRPGRSRHRKGARSPHKLLRVQPPVAAQTSVAPAPLPAAPPPVALVEGVAGQVKARLDAKTEFDSFPLEWFKPLARVLAYPPAGDRYAAAGIPTLAYHDAWTTWGSSGATHISEYVAWVRRDKEHGYLGQFMDDVNFAGGNIAGTPAQYADLIEAVRGALGPAGVIEVNAQMWNLKSMLGNPDVQRALKFVNVVTKEFNVDPTSGISSAAKYGEYLEYAETLRAKGIGITLAGDPNYNSEADKEYSLASYLLVNTGLDFIGFSRQSPRNEYPALKGMNLGEQTQPRAQLPGGLWTRVFTHGEAIVAPPGTSGSVALPRPMTRIGTSSPVTSVSLSGGQGAVLSG